MLRDTNPPERPALRNVDHFPHTTGAATEPLCNGGMPMKEVQGSGSETCEETQRQQWRQKGAGGRGLYRDLWSQQMVNTTNSWSDDPYQ